MNTNNKTNEATIEAPAKDIKTLKSTNAIDKNDTVKVVDDKTSSTTPTSVPSMTEEDGAIDAVIKPQDSETIKYLSNVKDAKTGEVSKPFSIGEKKYQLIRGIKPSKEIVMAVYCLDDKDEAGENIIHPMEHFEENIAKKAVAEGGADDFNRAERDFHDKENLAVDEPAPVAKPAPAASPIADKPKTENAASLKLAEFKHFIVNNKTGKVRKFKRSEELAKANMTEDESYMNLSQFKKHVDATLFGSKKPKQEVSEENDVPIKPDVQVAIDQMVLKVKPYISKINEPIEKIQFLVKLATMLQLEASKYPALISALKKASDESFGGSNTTNSTNTTSTTQTTSGIAERKVMTKNQLMESVKQPKVIETIKVKNIQ